MQQDPYHRQDIAVLRAGADTNHRIFVCGLPAYLGWRKLFRNYFQLRNSIDLYGHLWRDHLPRQLQRLSPHRPPLEDVEIFHRSDFHRVDIFNRADLDSVFDCFGCNQYGSCKRIVAKICQGTEVLCRLVYGVALLRRHGCISADGVCFFGDFAGVHNV